jgi:hypothetical protein
VFGGEPGEFSTRSAFITTRRRTCIRSGNEAVACGGSFDFADLVIVLSTYMRSSGDV